MLVTAVLVDTVLCHCWWIYAGITVLEFSCLGRLHWLKVFGFHSLGFMLFAFVLREQDETSWVNLHYHKLLLLRFSSWSEPADRICRGPKKSVMMVN